MNWTREYDAIVGEEEPSAEYEELLKEIQGIREDAQRHHSEMYRAFTTSVALFVLWKMGVLEFLYDLSSALWVGVFAALMSLVD